MRIPAWLFIAGIIVVVGATALLSVLSFTVARQVAIDFGNNGLLPVVNIAALPTPTRIPVGVLPTPQATTSGLSVTEVAPSDATNQPQVTPNPLDGLPAWSDNRRFTLLLLGIDQRSGVDEPGGYRTDTMIVISVDPVRKTAGVLNIPRDLWVDIPGYQQGRINTANSLGESGGYPGGGPALAAETVRQVLGFPIDKYLLINFDVFTKVVDTVASDGVEVCPREAIDDQNYPDAGYGFITVHFDAGCQLLTAERLLQYARTRHGATDFDRAERQQEVMKSLREKVLSVGGVTQFISQAPTLYTELADSFKTNLSIDEILQLGGLVAQIPRENIHFGVMNYLYVDQAKTTSGDEVLILKTNAIRPLIQSVFYPDESLTLSDLRSRAEAENGTIVVFNNTDVVGLAGQTRDWLAGKGVDVTEVGNTPNPSNIDTVIRVYTGKVWTAKYLAALMGLPEERVQPGADGLTARDVAIIVGPDIQPILTGQ
jgi:polyisoprenyl-teichoic acid--peptidoglycan teichoic acid transferase